NEVRDALEKTLGEPKSARMIWKPKTGTPVDEDTARSLLKMLDVLEDSDDVQQVYANFEIADEVMAKLSA
ncbi:YebC/PmpR family DNA-binding transcriptional regulator, partial [Vibrio parahaemolyticus]